MGRTKAPRKRMPVNVAKTQSGQPPFRKDDLAALLQMIRSLPSQPLTNSTSHSEASSPKRAKTTQDFRPICLAREHVSLPAQNVEHVETAITTRQNVGKAVMISFSMERVPRTHIILGWNIKLAPRLTPKTGGFDFTFVVGVDDLSPSQICALRAASQQGFDTEDHGSIWACVDSSIRQQGTSVHLELDIAIFWNESLGYRQNTKPTDPQETLRSSILAQWYPELPLSQPSPQDFYEAAFVPDKDAFDRQVSALQVPDLEASLYPFQRRAVQWLLQREGARWCGADDVDVSGVQTYTAPHPDVPFTFETAKDADGDAFYLSRIFGVATRDLSAFRAIQASQDIRGGILAEEMGLGKTLEVISLMLLHPRPHGPAKVLDSYLGKELLATSATLIVAPSALLDQWISEINRHAPTLSVMFYPGLKKASKNAKQKITPELLSQYDVVITTYEALRGEIWLALASEEPARETRNTRQHERPVSPLVQLSWWRLCIDEAQMVENWTNNAAKLAKLIPRINAWAITGTPVRDDIQKDIRGLLNFLRYEPYASDGKAWDSLATRCNPSFRALITSVSLRHTKALVRSEISIPPQHRFVITMPFTAVEEQHYQSLFQELAEMCGLDTQGAPIAEKWNPDDAVVPMRVALDRLRQTALHPDVGSRNRRALGQKANPMRTVAEVLAAMLEQSEGAKRTDQRNLFQCSISKGLILAGLERTEEALAVWEAVREKSAAVVNECRLELQREMELASKSGSSTEKRISDGDRDDDLDDGVPLPITEASRRLRFALEIHHKAVFFCANGYFSLKSNEEKTPPDSEEFRRLEKLEVDGYDLAKAIRKEILQETYSKAKSWMDKLTVAANGQSFAIIPASKAATEQGIECRRIIAAFDQVTSALDLQANQVDEWREHVIQLLLQPLLDEETGEVTGEEFDKSTKLQDEIHVYTLVLRSAIADRQSAITGQLNFLIETETKAALRFAKHGEGPAPEELVALFALREQLNPECTTDDPYTSLRGLLSELRSLLLKLRSDAANGNQRATNELSIATNLQKLIQSQTAKQTKAITAMEHEIEDFKDTLNARIEYYRQLQAVSDMVEGREGPTDQQDLVAIVGQEEALQRKMAAAESKHRYLLHLKQAEATPEEQTCVICQSPFSIGVLTVCGHQFCKECITLWFRAHHNCPVCKRQLVHGDLHDITLKPRELKVHTESAPKHAESHNQQVTPSKKISTIYSEFNPEKLAEIKNIDLDGPNFTTKVDTLVRHLLWLRQSDPGAKSIVFSQYKDFLNVLEVAFERYRIGYSSFDKSHGTASFVDDAGTEVFLLHARAHASGLNLVNASHVFLCEPLLNTALELQAIARVDRIGQQHETTVWLYLVDGTVEESIYNLSVQRRMEHLGRSLQLSGKSKESTPELLDASLDVANAMELQQAQLTKLMGKDGISGEAVDKKDLWTCLFGHRGPQAEGEAPRNAATRRFLGAEAAEERRMMSADDG